MKIPRLSSGPFCWSLEQWAMRMACSDLTLALTIVIVCFYLISNVDDALTTQEEKDAAQVAKSIFIGLGVVFCIPVFFAIILIVGLFTRNKKLHLIWCYYAMVACVIFLILFFGLSILLFTFGDVGLGFGMLLFGAVITGHQAYSVAIVHSIYLNLKEAEIQTSHAQQS